MGETESPVSFCELLTPDMIETLIRNGTNPGELFAHYWWCSPESTVHWGVKTFTIPILIILGSIGNVLAFVVLTRRLLQQSSVCVYMSLYALMNTIVLFIGCGLDWVSYITQTHHVANQADWICRLWKFLFNVVNYSGGWLVVAMAADRFVKQWYPRHAQQLGSVFMAKVIVVCLLVGLVAISIHAMWTFALTPHGCHIDATGDMHAFQTIVWPIVSAVFLSYLPVGLILVLAAFLLAGLLHPPNQGAGDAGSSGTAGVGEASLQHKLTVLVLAVSVVYLLLYLPTVIVNIIVYSVADYSRQIRLRVQIFLIQELCQTMACLNHAITFILYFAGVPALRQEFVTMVKVLRRPRSNRSIGEELHAINTNGEIVVSHEKDTSVTLL